MSKFVPVPPDFKPRHYMMVMWQGKVGTICHIWNDNSVEVEFEYTNEVRTINPRDLYYIPEIPDVTKQSN